MSEQFDIVLGPNVTFTTEAGSTLLSSITSASLTVNSVESTVPATGSASVNASTGSLDFVLNIPQGTKGNDGTPAPVGTPISALTGTNIAMSTDGSPVAYNLVLSENITLTLSAGVIGKLSEAILIITQPAAGAIVVTLPSNATAVGTVAVSTAASATTILRFITIDGGATYFVSTY